MRQAKQRHKQMRIRKIVEFPHFTYSTGKIGARLVGFEIEIARRFLFWTIWRTVVEGHWLDDCCPLQFDSLDKAEGALEQLRDDGVSISYLGRIRSRWLRQPGSEGRDEPATPPASESVIERAIASQKRERREVEDRYLAAGQRPPDEPSYFGPWD